MRFSTALLVERLVDQLLGLGAQVDGAGAGVAAPLDHADEADIVGGVDPEPGAIDAEPVIGADRRGRCIRRSSEFDRAAPAEAAAKP